MTQVIALSLSIAVLGGIWAFLALGPLSGFVLVWAGFIGWGCFFHSGANNNALVKTIIGNAYGALVAWVALLIIVNVPVPGLGAVWPAIVVGVTVFFLVIVASIALLSVVRPTSTVTLRLWRTRCTSHPPRRPLAHCRTWSRPRSPTRWS